MTAPPRDDNGLSGLLAQVRTWLDLPDPGPTIASCAAAALAVGAYAAPQATRPVAAAAVVVITAVNYRGITKTAALNRIPRLARRSMARRAGSAATSAEPCRPWFRETADRR